MPRLKNPYTGPGPSGHIGEIFLRQTTRIRSNRGKSLVMKAQSHNLKSPYPDLVQLAKAILRQACVDAGHVKLNNYGMRRHRHTRGVVDRSRRNDCWDALQFLTDPNDEWLGFWCELAGMNPHHLRHEFLPYRAKFEQQHKGFAA